MQVTMTILYTSCKLLFNNVESSYIGCKKCALNDGLKSKPIKTYYC